MKPHRAPLLIAFIFLAFGANIHAEEAFAVRSEKEHFVVRKLLSHLSRPWGLAFLPGGQLLISERTGNLLLVDDGMTHRIRNVPNTATVGQGGLLDVAISPDYTKNRRIYLSFTEEKSGIYGVAVAWGKLTGLMSLTPTLSDVHIIYRASPKSSGGLHFGSRLAFDKEKFLYITLGERGTMNRAQNPLDPYGSVIRIGADGSIPLDNPFVSDRNKGAPEVWSYGHRNAQGMAIHPLTGEIWLHEHGPKGGDELNIIKKAANYGWPRVTYGINYDGSTISRFTEASGIIGPVVHWTPSIAPSGLAFYEGRYFPSWKGNIFIGALAGKHLRRLELRENTVIHQEVLLKNRIGRIRDVRTGPDGSIYLLTDADRGALYRLESP